LFSDICDLYHKPMTIINDDSRVFTKLQTSLTDDARVVIYNRHMFIVLATGEHKNLHETAYLILSAVFKIRHLWVLDTVTFLNGCLLHAVLLAQV
jgi:hypothetical protein